MTQNHKISIMKIKIKSHFVMFIPIFVFFGCTSNDSAKTNYLDNDQKKKEAHFHHVHLNTTSPEHTLIFYENFFGANRIKYRNKSKALFTEKSFILLDSINQKPISNLGSSLWHIGWAGVDAQSEFQWRVKEGIDVQTPLTELLIRRTASQVDTTHYMYFWGPSREIIEIYTGNKNHRFEHVHLLASDLEASIEWFKKNLGLTPIYQEPILFHGTHMTIFHVDNVNLILSAKPFPDSKNSLFTDEVWPKEGFKATEGTAVDHIAFSYEEIDQIFNQFKSSGLEIVKGISKDKTHGLNSFFVLGPDSLMVEIVKEKSIPSGIWSNDPSITDK